MATRKVYIGSVGPFLYDDTNLINDPDGDFAGQTQRGLVCNGQLLVTETPALSEHIVRYGDISLETMSILSSATIDGQTLTKQTIYTVPAGVSLIPYGFVIHSPSASLAGLDNFDLGGNVDADDWIQEVSLDAFTATTNYGYILQPEQVAGPPIVPVERTVYAATTIFGIKINTGSTGAATFKIVILGFVF